MIQTGSYTFLWMQLLNQESIIVVSNNQFFAVDYDKFTGYEDANKSKIRLIIEFTNRKTNQSIN